MASSLLIGICKTCGKEFEYYIGCSNGIFCSGECYHAWARGKNHPRYKEKVSITCIQCGKEEDVNPSIAKTRKFCSRSCKGDWQKEHLRANNNPNWRGGITKTERICIQCGETFQFFTSLLSQQPCVFCSVRCRSDYLDDHIELKNKMYKKIFKARAMRPNKLEIKFTNTLDDNELPYKYVGDGTVVIGGRCPDFINTEGKKKLIELFGYYWHSPKYRPNIRFARTVEGTQKHYTDHGYDCLILWEDEIEDEKMVVERIRKYTGEMKCA